MDPMTPNSPAGAGRADAWSIASAASLACGIFLIVPFLAGAAALALGLIGIRAEGFASAQANQSNLRGRRLAIAGVFLGLLNLVGWTAYFQMIAQLSGPGRSVARLFFDDLTSANAPDAHRQCLASVRSDRLTAATNQLKKWGGVRSVAVLYVTRQTTDGIATGSAGGTLGTPSGQHAFQLQIVCLDNGIWKISDFSLR
jgi:hypothetical protein